MKFVLGAAVLAVGIPTAASSQAPTLQQAIGDPDGFRLAGSVRLRYEMLGGQPRAGLPPEDEQLDLRSILLAEYDTGVVRIGAEMYDSRAWLMRPGSPISTNEINTFELVQAYVGADFEAPFGKGSRLALQAGRFTLNLGSRRLVAADEGRNTTNGYTGVRGDVRTAGGVTATAIYVLPQIRLPDDLPSLLAHETQWDRESFDLQLWGGYVARPDTLAGATVELGYFGLFERDWEGHPTRNRDLDSFSLRVTRDPKAGKADVEVEAIAQLGTIRTSTATTAPDVDVASWFLHAEAGYSFVGPAKLRLAFEYDHASGDAPGGKFTRFDTLFGMRRVDFGPAGIYSAIGRTNVIAPGIRAEIAPNPTWDAFVTYKSLWLAEKTDTFSTSGVRDASGNSGSFAGHQFDTRVRYWLVPAFLRAELNAAWLAKGRFLKAAPNAPQTGDARYLSVAVTATF